MATTLHILERFPAFLGYKPVTVGGYIRNLRANNLLPIGGKGGGKSAAHLYDEDLKNFLLGLAGQQPSDAADAVRALNGLVYEPKRSSKKLPPMPEDSRRFGEMIRLAIVKLLDPGMAAACRKDEALKVLGLKSSRITMCLNPLWACITTPVYGKGLADEEEWFLPPDRDLIEQPQLMAHRPFILENVLLLEAAELLADTLAKRPAPTLIPDPAPGSAGEGNATPQTTKASGTGIHEGLQSGQSAHSTQTESLNTAKSIAGEGRKQLRFGPGDRGSQVRRHDRTSTQRTAAMTQRIGLTQLPRKIAEHTGQAAPTYRKCFDGAVNGRFPAEFAGSRWTVDLADLDAIATGLGLALVKPAAKPARKSAATSAAA